MQRFLIIVGAAVCLPLLFVVLGIIKGVVGAGIHLAFGLGRDGSLAAASFVLCALCGAALAAVLTSKQGA